MNHTQESKWLAWSALGAAMFALGFSVTGVACNTPTVSQSEATRAGHASPPEPAASLSTVSRVVNGVSEAAPVMPSAAPQAPGPAEIPSKSVGGLTLKRLVVTHEIEQREPTTGGDFKLGAAPVFAFVELENSTADARSIRVLFENEDTRATVGHVKLSVPAAQARYRTWGNTRQIHEAGHWVAIVTTSDGVELGRAPFEVKG